VPAAGYDFHVVRRPADKKPPATNAYGQFVQRNDLLVANSGRDCRHYLIGSHGRANDDIGCVKLGRQVNKLRPESARIAGFLGASGVFKGAVRVRSSTWARSCAVPSTVPPCCIAWKIDAMSEIRSFADIGPADLHLIGGKALGLARLSTERGTGGCDWKRPQ
jgi:hypothetical protein